MDNIDEWMNRALNEGKTSSSDSKNPGQAMPLKAAPQAGFQQKNQDNKPAQVPANVQANRPGTPPFSANAKRRKRHGHGGGFRPPQGNQPRPNQPGQTQARTQAQTQGQARPQPRQPQPQANQAGPRPQHQGG